jgi:hypothetical protein
LTYDEWLNQQGYLASAGGYGPPPAPPPDPQQAPPPADAPIPNYDGGAAPVDPNAPPPAPVAQPVAPAPSNSTWGGMAAAPPPQSPPATPPPSGPALGPTGANQSGPVGGGPVAGAAIPAGAPIPAETADAGVPLNQNGDQYLAGGQPPQPDNPAQQVPPMEGAPPINAWLGQAVQTAAPALSLVPGGPLAATLTAGSPRAQADRAAAQRAAAAPSPGLGGVPVPHRRPRSGKDIRPA